VSLEDGIAKRIPFLRHRSETVILKDCLLSCLGDLNRDGRASIEGHANLVFNVSEHGHEVDEEYPGVIGQVARANLMAHGEHPILDAAYELSNTNFPLHMQLDHMWNYVPCLGCKYVGNSSA
jgi:hypothetical protein